MDWFNKLFLEEAKNALDKHTCSGGSSGGSGGPSVKPDYNQNNPNASDYIKNRPFYTSDPVETVLFDDTVNATNFELLIELNNSAVIEPDTDYDVVYDGVEYHLTSIAERDFCYIGSMSILMDGEMRDEEPPFVIIGDADRTVWLLDPTCTTHTIRITASLKMINHIDTEYIPDMYGTFGVRRDYVVKANFTIYGNSDAGVSRGVIRIDSAVKFIKGSEYMVDFNGDSYTCACEDGYGIGNPKIFDYLGEDVTDNGLPFYVGINPSEREASVYVYNVPEDTIMFIRVYGDIPSVRKIPDKYINDWRVYGMIDNIFGSLDEFRSKFIDSDSPVVSGSFSMNREDNTETGMFSSTLGYGNTASGYCSHAEGYQNSATNSYAHAEGRDNTVSGYYSHVEGGDNTLSGNYSHVEGGNNNVTNGYAHAEGKNNTISNNGAYAHVEGQYNIAYSSWSHVQGKFNISDSDATYAHIVGNGGHNARSNAHTLDWNGNATFAGTVTGTGADYAEYFEWVDGNPTDEDRVGLIVTLEGEKIRLANSDDEILGVVTGTAMVLGDNAEWEWRQKYLVDDYGRVITEMVEEFSEIPNAETGETEKVSLGFFPHRKLNPDFDPEQKYIRRCDRPEWETIGMLGKIHVTDDGTCVVGGYAMVGENGIATASTEKTCMRVMKRITDNIILVLMK